MAADPVIGSGTLAPTEAKALSLPRPGVDKATNQQAAQMFEGLLMTQMFQAMRKTIPSSGLFGENAEARSTYEYLLDQAVSEHAMTSGKGWGLAARLEKAWAAQKGVPSTPGQAGEPPRQP